MNVVSKVKRKETKSVIEKQGTLIDKTLKKLGLCMN